MDLISTPRPNQPSHGATPTAAPLKRGRGRPPGSRNKPKVLPVPMTEAEREALARESEALKQQLAASYVAALVTKTLAGIKAARIKAMIRSKLGRDALASIEAEIVTPAISEQADAA